MMIQITMFYFLHNPHVVLRKYMQHSKAMLPRGFLWGYVKDKAFVPPVPVALDDLKQRITTATAGVDENTCMLTRVWQEFDYRVDICRVTKNAHIEHL
jgi:hypothetical protein